MKLGKAAEPLVTNEQKPGNGTVAFSRPPASSNWEAEIPLQGGTLQISSPDVGWLVRLAQ